MNGLTIAALRKQANLSDVPDKAAARTRCQCRVVPMLLLRSLHWLTRFNRSILI